MKVVHLLDDPALGGVNRLLEDILPPLCAWDHEKIVLPTGYRIAPAFDADVAIVHFTASWAKLPFLASLRRRFAGRPVIMIEHSYTAGYEGCCVEKIARFRRMLRAAYGLCDGVIAVSHEQSRWLVQAGLVKPQKLAVMPPALDLSAFRTLQLLEPRSGPLRLLAYGRYAPQKGYETLVKAIRLLPEDSVTLTMAGYGPLEETLRGLAVGASNIVINGPTSDPAALLADAEAVAIPSRWEPYGLVASEARMAARPIVASRIDGLIDQIDARNGMLVPADDPLAFAEAIAALCHADLRAMGAAGRASAIGQWENYLTAWRRLLGRLSAPNAAFEPAWRLWRNDVSSHIARREDRARVPAPFGQICAAVCL